MVFLSNKMFCLFLTQAGLQCANYVECVCQSKLLSWGRGGEGGRFRAFDGDDESDGKSAAVW